jgi:hypothetical protein
MSANFVAIGIGMGVAGPLLDSLGARAAFGVSAAVYGCAAVAGFMLVGNGLARRRPIEAGV